MEQPGDTYYGAAMKKAVLDGKISAAELDGHVRRILRTEFASGIIDYPIRKGVVDAEDGLLISRGIAEESIVLLKNAHGLLPLDRSKNPLDCNHRRPRGRRHDLRRRIGAG